MSPTLPFIFVAYLYSDSLTCRKDTPSMEVGWEDMSCDSDTSPNFNLTAPRSQDETEAANMLSKDLYFVCMYDIYAGFYLLVGMYLDGLLKGSQHQTLVLIKGVEARHLESQEELSIVKTKTVTNF